MLLLWNYNIFIFSDPLRADIITETGRRSNIIIAKEEDINEFLKIKNEKPLVTQERRKRHTSMKSKFEGSKQHYELKYNDNYFRKAREIITNYENACEPGNENALCKDIVQELKHIKHSDDISPQLPDKELNEGTKTTQKKRQTFKPTEAVGDGTKTTPNVIVKEHEQIKSDVISNDNNQYIIEPYSGIHPHYNTPAPNNCLLARLLQQSYPDGKHIYYLRSINCSIHIEINSYNEFEIFQVN